MKIKRHWSFSGLVTMRRILLMNHLSTQGFFEPPQKDRHNVAAKTEAPLKSCLYFKEGLEFKLRIQYVCF